MLGALLINALIAGAVWQSHRQAMSDGQRNAQRLVQILEAQTRGTFEAADLALSHFKTILEQPDQPPTHDVALRDKLNERAAALPYVLDFFAAGADGSVAHNTDSPAVPSNVAAEDYFTVHRGDGDTGLFVGHPLKRDSTTTWIVPLSRKVERNGVFSGIVAASVDTGFFAEIKTTLDLDRHDSIALFASDATLIAHVPAIETQIGQALPQLSLFQKHSPQVSDGTYSSRSLRGRQAIISYRRIGSLPLVATVALDEWQLLAPWRRAALTWWVAALLGTALVIVLGIVVNRYRRERQIALARALKAQKLEALGHMTGGIAHDFNNVLGVVGASFRLIRRSGADEQYVAAGEQALERGARLATQLMSFAKSHELSRGLQDANELLRSLAPMIKQAAGPTVRVTYDLDNGVPLCLVDRAQFDAAIINLVVNAAQAMNRSGQIVISTNPVTVRKRGKGQTGRYVAVRVKDRGCGIAPADLKRVFEPFYTTKAEGGTGLGLAQVHAFMRQIGGDVRIRSKVGAGTTVELRFPCWEADATQTAARSERQGHSLSL